MVSLYAKAYFFFLLFWSDGQGVGTPNKLQNHFSRSGCRADAGLANGSAIVRSIEAEETEKE
jgi:hypothetical protein